MSDVSGPTAQPYRAAVRSMLRDRLLDAAEAAFALDGWRKLTMAKVADRAGVSRQTVYTEVGSKPALAETMILEELARFLQVVEQAFDAEPDDLTRAIERAVTMAAAGDVVLIAGKGHEKYQQIGDRVLPFDDGEVARAALAKRRSRAGS